MILGLALTKNQFVSNSSLPKSSLQGPLQFPTKSNGSPNKEGQMNHQLILYKVSPKVESDFLIRESFPTMVMEGRDYWEKCSDSFGCFDANSFSCSFLRCLCAVEVTIVAKNFIIMSHTTVFQMKLKERSHFFTWEQQYQSAREQKYKNRSLLSKGEKPILFFYSNEQDLRKSVTERGEPWCLRS